MPPFHVLSLLLAIAALLAFLNARFTRLPSTIGALLGGLGISVGLLALGQARPEWVEGARSALVALGFDHVLMDVMLAFLLFAGALHVRLEDLVGVRWTVGLLATVGVAVSTVVVAVLARGIAAALGLELGWLEAALFGALIAPTDPIAVLGIVRRAGASRKLETKITGESLFNDGVGVVVFTLLLGFALQREGADDHGVAELLAREILGAFALGAVAGWITYFAMRRIDDYKVEVLLSLALCSGVYSLAAELHSSGPLAVVVAGLLVGNRARRDAMSDTTREHIDVFWELVDEVLNVLLFVFVGAELLVVVDGDLAQVPWLAGLLAIPAVLLARFVAVAGTVRALSLRREFPPATIRILTWGGLRGGISVALALSLPAEHVPARDLILTMTYVVVVFSLVVQGLTIGRVVRAAAR